MVKNLPQFLGEGRSSMSTEQVCAAQSIQEAETSGYTEETFTPHNMKPGPPTKTAVEETDAPHRTESTEFEGWIVGDITYIVKEKGTETIMKVL